MIDCRGPGPWSGRGRLEVGGGLRRPVVFAWATVRRIGATWGKRRRVAERAPYWTDVSVSSWSSLSCMHDKEHQPIDFNIVIREALSEAHAAHRGAPICRTVGPLRRCRRFRRSRRAGGGRCSGARRERAPRARRCRPGRTPAIRGCPARRSKPPSNAILSMIPCFPDARDVRHRRVVLVSGDPLELAQHLCGRARPLRRPPCGRRPSRPSPRSGPRGCGGAVPRRRVVATRGRPACRRRRRAARRGAHASALRISLSFFVISDRSASRLGLNSPSRSRSASASPARRLWAAMSVSPVHRRSQWPGQGSKWRVEPRFQTSRASSSLSRISDSSPPHSAWSRRQKDTMRNAVTGSSCQW